MKFPLLIPINLMILITKLLHSKIVVAEKAISLKLPRLLYDVIVSIKIDHSASPQVFPCSI